MNAVKAKNYNQALRRACTSNHVTALTLIKILFDYKDKLVININEQAGEDKRTALHYAAITGNADVYEFLVCQGAKTDLKDGPTGNGMTAAQYMEKANKSRVKAPIFTHKS